MRLMGVPAGMRPMRRNWLVPSWNSMEVFLLATLLTLVDFGSLATIRAGAGALAFTAVVVMTTAGAVAFQPQALWLADPERYPNDSSRESPRQEPLPAS